MAGTRVHTFEVMASGYGVVEAPTVDAEGGIFFSDVTRGGVYRLSPEGSIDVAIPKRRGVGGVCLHKDGGLVVAGRDIAHVRNGETRVLFTAEDCPAPGPVGGFNDLCADPSGKLLIGPVQMDAERRKLPQNFLRVSAPHQAELIYPDVWTSNGVAVDPVRGRIYHAATQAQEIIVSDIGDDGAISIVRRFSTAKVEGIPDGLRIDAEGCVWVAFFRGGSVVRFSPEGEVLFEIKPPSRMTTSLCFAGPDMMDMYIATEDNSERPTLEGCLFRTRAPVPGIAVGMASV